MTSRAAEHARANVGKTLGKILEKTLGKTLEKTLAETVAEFAGKGAAEAPGSLSYPAENMDPNIGCDIRSHLVFNKRFSTQRAR
jgi:hypothetical protein